MSMKTKNLKKFIPIIFYACFTSIHMLNSENTLFNNNDTHYNNNKNFSNLNRLLDATCAEDETYLTEKCVTCRSIYNEKCYSCDSKVCLACYSGFYLDSYNKCLADYSSKDPYE